MPPPVGMFTGAAIPLLRAAGAVLTFGDAAVTVVRPGRGFPFQRDLPYLDRLGSLVDAAAVRALVETLHRKNRRAAVRSSK